MINNTRNENLEFEYKKKTVVAHRPIWKAAQQYDKQKAIKICNFIFCYLKVDKFCVYKSTGV